MKQIFSEIGVLVYKVGWMKTRFVQIAGMKPKGLKIALKNPAFVIISIIILWRWVTSGGDGGLKIAIYVKAVVIAVKYSRKRNY